jgi:hypothetical protein
MSSFLVVGSRRRRTDMEFSSASFYFRRRGRKINI